MNRIFAPLPAFDPESGIVVMEPERNENGYWVGSPTILHDGRKFWLTYRRRRPRGTEAERGWRCLALEGPFALEQTGIAAEFTRVLAAASVPLFVIATFDTDTVLVPDKLLERAVSSLRAAGHTVRV